MPCIISSIVNSLRPFFVVSKISRGGILDQYYSTTNLLVRTEDILYNSYSFAVIQTSTTTSTTSQPLTEDRETLPAPAAPEGCGCKSSAPVSEKEAVLVSCEECGVTCGDKHEKCEEWAKKGDCSKEQEYMNVMCPMVAIYTPTPT